MNEIYDFNWLIDDIDESIIFMLRDGKEMLGSYYISDLVTNGLEDSNVKFANISDLTNFVSYTTVRFTNSLDNTSIIEIPLRCLNLLYQKAKEITADESNGISLQELDAFGVNDKQVIRNGCAIYAYKINEPSSDLQEIMHFTHDYINLNMNEKINALEEINLINYQRNSKHKQK